MIQPKRLAAFERNQLITTQLSEYKLYVHNDKYEIVDTILRTKTEWTNKFKKIDFSFDKSEVVPSINGFDISRTPIIIISKDNR